MSKRPSSVSRLLLERVTRGSYRRLEYGRRTRYAIHLSVHLSSKREECALLLLYVHALYEAPGVTVQHTEGKAFHTCLYRSDFIVSLVKLQRCEGGWGRVHDLYWCYYKGGTPPYSMIVVNVKKQQSRQEPNHPPPSPPG